MFIYLWNLCKFVLLKIAAVSWNVVIKLVQGEQPKENTAKGEQQPQNNTAKGKVSMANEVWTEVLGFVKRDQLAEVSLTNRHIHQICWPRFPGNKVMAHTVEKMIIASRGQPPTAILQIEEHRKEVPFVNCSPPDYITGFRDIFIKFLDDQVLAFIEVIAPHLTKTGVYIYLSTEVNNLDAQQRGFMNRLLKIFQEKSPTLICVQTSLGNIKFLPDMDNKTRHLLLKVSADMDIPLLMKWLATPRLDGQQRVISLNFEENEQLTVNMVDAIKKEFRTSSKPLPQPFYLSCDGYHPRPAPPHNLNIPRSEEENAQTDETLTISPNHYEYEEESTWGIEIYRHPKGEHEKWAKDARKTQSVKNNGRKTYIHLWNEEPM